MISVAGLTRRYGDFVAVDDISFTAQPGRVTGFLGPNGAGKTTTMRVMVGLTPATAGHVTIGGHAYADIPNPGRHVGVLLDASAQHAGRSGREMLTVGARTMGLPDPGWTRCWSWSRSAHDEAKRRVRNYSLGMKQRLGIAHALLGDPSVLILDEPANGLDPAGIRWMRGLLKGYADRGGTVLLSSHLLHEVEMIADEMILIGRGKIVAQGDKERSLAGAKTSTLVTSLDNARWVGADQAAIKHSAAGRGSSSRPRPSTSVGSAAEHSIVLTDLRPAEGGLEDLFLELTAETQREGHCDPGSLVMTHQTTAPGAPRISGCHRASRSSPGRGWSCASPLTPGRASGCWRSSGHLVVIVEALFVAVTTVQDADDLRHIRGRRGLAPRVLLPVLGIMLVTSEWGQRTAMVTFALEPRRRRVVWAKR